MASISSHLEFIKNAIYGREVRSSIHDAIEAINSESENSSRISRNAIDKATEASNKVNDVISKTNDAVENTKNAVKQVERYKDDASLISTEIDNKRQQIDQIVNNISEYKNSIITHISEVYNIKNEIDSNIETLNNKLEKFDTLSGTIENIKTQIAQLQSDISSINTPQDDVSDITFDILNNSGYSKAYSITKNFTAGDAKKVDLPYGGITHFRYTPSTLNDSSGLMEVTLLLGDRVEQYSRIGSNVTNKWRPWKKHSLSDENYTTVKDANTMKTSGHFITTSSTTNKPGGSSRGILVVYSVNLDLDIVQLWFPTESYGMYVRSCRISTWTSWKYVS